MDDLFAYLFIFIYFPIFYSLILSTYIRLFGYQSISLQQYNKIAIYGYREKLSSIIIKTLQATLPQLFSHELSDSNWPTLIEQKNNLLLSCRS